MAAPLEVTGSGANKLDMFSSWCFKYIPLSGSLSVIGFSTHVMAPTLFKRAFTPREMTVANCMWFNAHLGIGLYIYNTKHVRKSAKYQQILYSAFGAVIFNFGTTLLWATTKNVLPKCGFVRSMFGVASALAMLTIGRSYLVYVDSALTKCEVEAAEE